MVKKTPAYKNRLKALELERSGGITSKKKSQKNMDKYCYHPNPGSNSDIYCMLFPYAD